VELHVELVELVAYANANIDINIKVWMGLTILE